MYDEEVSDFKTETKNNSPQVSEAEMNLVIIVNTVGCNLIALPLRQLCISKVQL